MNTIDDLIAIIIKMTGRPDQKEWALMAINTCVKEVVRSADYPEDLFETEFLADDPDGATLSGPMQLALPDLPDFLVAPSFPATIRKIAYLTYDNQKLTEVTPQNLLLANCPELDVFYRNGQNQLVVNPSKPYRSFKVGVYCIPNAISFSSGQYHWTFDAASEVLITGTIAKVFKSTGDDASHDRYYQEYLRLLRQFKLDHVNSGVL